MADTITLAIDALASAAFIEGGVSIERTDEARQYTEQRKRELLEAIATSQSQAVAAQAAPAAVVNWEEAARAMSVEIARNCNSVPQLVFPFLYLGLKKLLATPALPATEDSSAGDLAEEKIADEMSREERMIVLQRDSDGTPTVWCDPEIADIVCALNSGGVKTVASCSGHGVKPGGIALADGRQILLLESLEAFNSAMSAITQAVVQAEPSGPYGWRAVIADARMRLDNDHPSAYDNSGYRDFAGNVLDTVEDELSALEAALAPSAKEKLDQSTFEFSIWCAEWFGPDADDSYLAKAVRALPPMTQNFERPAQTAPQAQPAGALYAHQVKDLPPIPEDPLWKWFGLSYASWLTLPRVLMHAMPTDWKVDMTRLLNRWDETWKAGIMPDTRIQAVGDNGKLTKMPEWLNNYRHPDHAGLENLKEPSARTSQDRTAMAAPQEGGKAAKEA